jgi:TrmH family RNA methyltransferase
MLGRKHDLIRRVRALRRDGKQRRAAGLYLAEGRHLAHEALRSEAPVELFLVSPALREDAEGRALLQGISRRGLPLYETADSVLDSLQDARTAQPVLALVRRQERSVDDLLATIEERPLIAVAHAIQDPGNLGSIMRSADAAGAALFVTTGEGADLHHPRTIRATMGSIFRLPAAAAPFARLLELLRDRDIRALAADPAAATAYHAIDLTRPTALFFGSESEGLPKQLLNALDGTVNIPMRNGVESLSVGAAAAVLLFEAARQRSARQDRCGE